MAEQYLVTNGSVALVAATAKTIVELATGSTIDNVLTGFDVSFDGVTAGAVPVKVELITSTATGTGTGSTPTRIGQNQGRASVTTAKINLTVEGSTPTVIATYFVPPTSGLSVMWPLGREPAMTVSKFYALRVTAPAVVNVACNVWFEE